MGKINVSCLFDFFIKFQILLITFFNCQSELFFGFCLPNIPSKKIPAKTRIVPTHCLLMRLFPKMMTEARTVKNFLVVVMMLQGRGPNSETHMKMKNWPKALATENEAICQRTEGWRETKLMNWIPSPVTRSA